MTELHTQIDISLDEMRKRGIILPEGSLIRAGRFGNPDGIRLFFYKKEVMK